MTAITQFKFGIDVQLNGQTIHLEPKQMITDLTQLNKMPIAVALPPNTHINLGSVGGSLTTLQKELNEITGANITFPTAEDLPKNLQVIMKTLLQAEVTITQFELNIGSPKGETPTRSLNAFRIGLSISLGASYDGGGAKLGPVGVQGLNFLFVRTNDGA